MVKKEYNKQRSRSTENFYVAASPSEIAFRQGRSRHAPGATKCVECGARLSTCRKCKILYCPACAEENSGHRRCGDCYPAGASQLLARVNPSDAKRNVDFVALVSRYAKLRRAGRQFVGLCPFHSENTPSFYVHPQRKVFKCFGRCDAGGDVFDFVMRAEHCDFPSALRIVSDFSKGSSDGQRREAARFGRSVETVGFSARGAGGIYSRKPSARAELLARLDATDRRNAAIRAANDAASAEFATACEPLRGEAALSGGVRVRPADANCREGRGRTLHIYTSSNNFSSHTKEGSHGRR